MRSIRFVEARTGWFTLLAAVVLLPACASTKSPERMKHIQDNYGLKTKSLDYIGSSKRFHYFEQSVWPFGPLWIPGGSRDGSRTYRVRRSELELPEQWEFPHDSYEGTSDEREVNVRIKDQPHYHVQLRKSNSVRLVERIVHGPREKPKPEPKPVDKPSEEFVIPPLPGTELE